MTAFALCVVDLHTTTIKAAIKKVGCVRVETTVYILRKGIAHSTCGNQQFFLEGETAKVTYKRHASIGIRCKIKNQNHSSVIKENVFLLEDIKRSEADANRQYEHCICK